METPTPNRVRAGWLNIEHLEPRILLSADSISESDKAALVGGLNDLVGFAESVEYFGDLDAAMPVTGQALGQGADLSDILARGLLQPLEAFLNPDGSQAVADVVAFLGMPRSTDSWRMACRSRFSPQAKWATTWRSN